MALYAMRPIRVRGYVVVEGEPFEPNSELHGRELIEAGLASDSPPDEGEAAPKATAPAKPPGKAGSK